MDFALVVLATIGVLAVLILARLDAMLFILLSSITTLTGFSLMAENGSAEWTTFWSYGFCFGALCFGYLIGASKKPKNFIETKLQVGSGHATKINDGAVATTVILASALAIYHLLVGGIPLFSDSIEVERFDFSSSGLFGIPGRMYLYGVPLVWAFSSAVAHSRGIKWYSYTPWRIATFFYLLTSLLSGFKSGLSATVILAMIFSAVVMGRGISLRRYLLKFWWTLSVPIAYGLFVASTYGTYQASSQSIWRQIADRLTLVGAEPKQLAIEAMVTGAHPGQFIDDFSYFLLKYTGQDVSGMYSFERAVSAQIIGVNPASSAWTTPVTVGGIPEMIFSLGVPGSVFLFMGIGYILRLLNRPGRNAYYTTAKCAGVYAVYSWLTKGGVAYYLINIFAVFCLLTAVYVLANLLASSVRKKRPDGEHNAPHHEVTKRTATLHNAPPYLGIDS